MSNFYARHAIVPSGFEEYEGEKMPELGDTIELINGVRVSKETYGLVVPHLFHKMRKGDVESAEMIVQLHERCHASFYKVFDKVEDRLKSLNLHYNLDPYACLIANAFIKKEVWKEGSIGCKQGLKPNRTDEKSGTDVIEFQRCEKGYSVVYLFRNPIKND